MFGVKYIRGDGVIYIYIIYIYIKYHMFIFRTHIGRTRAWLRLALMQKKLADYFRFITYPGALAINQTINYLNYSVLNVLC